MKSSAIRVAGKKYIRINAVDTIVTLMRKSEWA